MKTVQHFAQRKAVDQGDNQSGRFQCLTTYPVTEGDSTIQKERDRKD